MKTIRRFRVAAALLLSAAMGSALVGRAEKPMAEGQQDMGPQEKTCTGRSDFYAAEQ